MNQPVTRDMRPTMLAEIAASFTELSNDMATALSDYAVAGGETAAAAPVLRVLNGDSILIEGAAAGAANFLRGRGYAVTEAGDILLAKVKRRPGKKKPASNPAEAMTLRSAKAGGNMEVYTEAQDINTLKRLYQKAVGTKAAVSFNMFCQQVDDIGSMHRELYGEKQPDEEGEEPTPRDMQLPAPIGRGGPTVLANEEPAADLGLAAVETSDAA